MSKCVLILGDSGVGKTASCRNLDPVTSLIIQPEPKDLPFRPVGWDKFSQQNLDGSIYQTSDYDMIKRVVHAAVTIGDKKTIIIDDSSYLMAFEELRRVKENGFQKFTEICVNFFDLIQFAKSLPDDVVIYFIGHTQSNEDGKLSFKTSGKMLDKLIIEGLFTTCFLAKAQDNRHYFETKTSGGFTPTKTPMGMFEESEIDNDLLIINKTINEYYGVTQ